jgi:thymidine kinase
MGYLQLIIGPMFSGKTTRLIEIYIEHKNQGLKVGVINFYQDTRYNNNNNNKLISHDKLEIPCVFTKTLMEFQERPEFDTTDILLINEGQFFPDLFETVIKWVNIYNKTIHICGLNGDYKRIPFHTISMIIPHCDDIILLHSLCVGCKENAMAIFSHRLVDNTEQICIGSNDIYEPLCRKCYNKYI